MEDVLGKELKAGDVVAYPGRRGSLLWINTATIRVLTPTTAYVETINNSNSCDEDGRQIALTRIDRFVKVEAAHANV